MIRVGALLLLYFICMTPLAAQYWRVIEQRPMPERVANNAVVEGRIGGKDYIYSFAGIDSTKTRQGIHLRSYRYDVEADLWESIPPLPDTLGKIAAGASRIGNIIYIIGGYHVFQTTETSSNRVHRFDISTNTYLEDGAPIPIPIDDQVQAVWRDSLIYVVTGWRGMGSTQGNVPSVQIYDPAKDEWSTGTSVPANDLYMAFGASGVIIEDTIFYYGGAAGTGFGITSLLRKGIINPDNPTSIGWLALNGDINHQGYRMAATKVGENPYWIGGSSNTYNYDGIAYDGTGGVPPANRSLWFDLGNKDWYADLTNELPMDLRGIGEISDTVKYLAGGMLANQWVSNKTYRLERSLTPVISNISEPGERLNPLQIFPNPGPGWYTIHGGKGTIDIWNIAGKIVYQNDNQIDEGHQIDLSDQPAGIYWIRVGKSVGTVFKTN